jgi:threonine/homoserine/homoserine lactone efflux protein
MTPFVEGMLAGYGIAIPIGAIAILIIDAALHRGFMAGLMAGAGAATADFLYATLAVVAGAIVAPVLAPFAAPLRITGGAVLIVIAGLGIWRGMRADSDMARRAPTSHPLRTYLQFVGLTIINPMTVVYFTALVLGTDTLDVRSRITPGLLFVAGAGLASLSWQSLLALLGSCAGRRLTPRMRLAATVVGNLIVFGLGARLILAGLA